MQQTIEKLITRICKIEMNMKSPQEWNWSDLKFFIKNMSQGI